MSVSVFLVEWALNLSVHLFQIPDVPKRDKVALALAEKASKAHRAKKEAALKQVTRRLAS